ncbi:hypothetical protein TTRE_0000419701 [Trichuris trichiura]|uniref:Uncharacterized protein n=1 Tax=Trichuris trichiura TaxID=36087 RepID=A0A077Z8F9_TRITR|nr:hypothetical protein TTRE_0000419701 [Trichuris trichiura]
MGVASIHFVTLCSSQPRRQGSKSIIRVNLAAAKQMGLHLVRQMGMQGKLKAPQRCLPPIDHHQAACTLDSASPETNPSMNLHHNVAGRIMYRAMLIVCKLDKQKKSLEKAILEADRRETNNSLLMDLLISNSKVHQWHLAKKEMGAHTTSSENIEDS